MTYSENGASSDEVRETDVAAWDEGRGLSASPNTEMTMCARAVAGSFTLPAPGETKVFGDIRITAVPVAGGAPFYAISHS